MASTLSYGFVKPATGDKGSTFWVQLENDIQQLNDHTHNGTNSAKLDASSAKSVTLNIPTGTWVDAGGGNYSQTKGLPAALTNVGGVVDDYNIQFRIASSGEGAVLSYVKATSTSITVYTNNPVSYTAFFT